MLFNTLCFSQVRSFGFLPIGKPVQNQMNNGFNYLEDSMVRIDSSARQEDLWGYSNSLMDFISFALFLLVSGEKCMYTKKIILVINVNVIEMLSKRMWYIVYICCNIYKYLIRQRLTCRSNYRPFQISRITMTQT